MFEAAARDGDFAQTKSCTDYLICPRRVRLKRASPINVTSEILAD